LWPPLISNVRAHVRRKFIFEGRFQAGLRDDVTGPLVVYVDECSLSVVGRERLIARSMLSIAPFHGSMLFGTIDHHQREDVLRKGYELVLSGSTLGVYDDGGGKDGEFDVFRLKSARIEGAFGAEGLSLRICAQTWPGSDVCYSAQEERQGAYPPIEVITTFTVPPHELQDFMTLRFSIDHEMFAQFKWKSS
jgi:hypothetical protein